MKLHLGCNTDYKVGWVNVDVNRSVKADLYCDVESDLVWVKENFYDEIFCSHLIEHLFDQRFFLVNCFRSLKVGGKLTVITPNQVNLLNRLRFLFGRPLPFNCEHKQEFSLGLLRDLVVGVGFVRVSFLCPRFGFGWFPFRSLQGELIVECFKEELDEVKK